MITVTWEPTANERECEWCGTWYDITFGPSCECASDVVEGDDDD